MKKANWVKELKNTDILELRKTLKEKIGIMPPRAVEIHKIFKEESCIDDAMCSILAKSDLDYYNDGTEERRWMQSKLDSK